MFPVVIGRSSLGVLNRPGALLCSTAPRAHLRPTQARNGLRTWKRLVNSEANVSVKAIPVEAAPRAGFSGSVSK